MTDKPHGTNGVAADVPGLPYYEKSRQHLKELLQKRKVLERQMHAREETIFQKETEYLDNTPAGNIITGFDNYVKGVAGAAAQRRKTGLTAANRVFSRSSISYNSSNAPTPLQTSFKDGAGSGSGSGPGSGQATPTSVSAHHIAAGATGRVGKKKKGALAAAAAAAAAAGIDDSETDSVRETKKMRTSFGARHGK